jgi:hypothetical protein
MASDVEFYEIGNLNGNSIYLDENCKTTIIIKNLTAGTPGTHVYLPNTAYLGKKIIIQSYGTNGYGKGVGSAYMYIHTGNLSSVRFKIFTGYCEFMYIGTYGVGTQTPSSVDNGWMIVGNIKGSTSYSDVTIGCGAVSWGTYGVAIGYGTSASGYACIALGNQAQAVNTFSTAIGTLATANGPKITFKTNTGFLSEALGSSQASKYTLFAYTTDAVMTSLNSVTPAAVNNVTATFTLGNNQTNYFIGSVIARNTTTGDVSTWWIKALVKRGANATIMSFVGTPSVTLISQDPSASTWSINPVLNVVVGSLDIQVIGQALTNIHWTCNIDETTVGS